MTDTTRLGWELQAAERRQAEDGVPTLHFDGRPRAPFWDLRWTPAPSEGAEEDSPADRRVRLSARTKLVDGTPVTVRVYRWLVALPVAEDGYPAPMPHSGVPRAERPTYLEELAVLEAGVVEEGECAAHWAPADLDPFDVHDWLVELDADLDPAELLEQITIHPLVFCVEGAHQWAFSDPPGHEFDEEELSSNLGSAAQAGEEGILHALSNRGEFVVVRTTDDAIPTHTHETRGIHGFFRYA